VAQDRSTAQQVYQDLGYGVEPGKAVIIILPEHIDVAPPVHLSPTSIVQQAIEITGPATRSALAGNCHDVEVQFQPARFVHRQGQEAAVEIEVAVLFPDDTLIPQNIQVGSFRPGVPCGPGYQIQRGHVLNTEY